MASVTVRVTRNGQGVDGVTIVTPDPAITGETDENGEAVWTVPDTFKPRAWSLIAAKNVGGEIVTAGGGPYLIFKNCVIEIEA